MSDSSSDIIIIGAGIAGLAAGCYAQMNGYRTQIFELHNLPGGLCTSWEREGYIFDGCLYYLFGSGTGQPFHHLWEELGTVQDREFIHHDEFMRVKEPTGQTLIVYSNPDRLEQHLKRLSPIDCWLIEDLCDGIRGFTRFDMSLLYQKPKVLMGAGDWLRLGFKLLPFVGHLAKWGNISAQEFGAQFQDPFLRRAIPQMFAWKDIPLMVGMSLLAYSHNRNAGVPVGDSLAFARAIAQRYLNLGGKIHFSSQVERVLVKSDLSKQQAIGVRLYNNEEFYAQRVIAACDGRGVLFNLLPDYTGDRIKRLYDGHLPTHSQIQVSLGVKRNLSHTPHWTTYLLDRPLLIAGEERHEINVKHYCYDPTF